jgi:hypothetical protein
MGFRALVTLTLLADAAWPEDNYYTPATGTGPNGESDGKPHPDKPANYNPYLIDLELPMPSVAYLCTAPGPDVMDPESRVKGTDQLACWGNADEDGVPTEESIRLAGYNCENCCQDGAEECFDYLYTIPKFVTRAVTKDYCCKGKLKPDFEALKARTLVMSEAEGVRPPECRDYMSMDDMNRHPDLELKGLRSCWMPHVGMSCEACCYNPDAHPVRWDSNYQEKVKENFCFNSDALEPTLGAYANILTPFQKWQKCCQDSGCDPAVHIWVCLVLPWTPYIALLFFMTVVLCCAIFEWALIGNKLCFKNPPKDEDPFALTSNAADAAKDATAAPPKKSAEDAGKPAKPPPAVKPSAVAPAEGAGALE